MHLKQLCTIICASVIISCSQQKQENITVEQLADMECRAIHLREQRFALADSLRFTQDSLLTSTTTIDTLRLKTRLLDMNTERQILLEKSLALADSIKSALDGVQRHLTTPKAREDFNEQLTKLLKERGCVEESF